MWGDSVFSFAFRCAREMQGRGFHHRRGTEGYRGPNKSTDIGLPEVSFQNADKAVIKKRYTMLYQALSINLYNSGFPTQYHTEEINRE